MERYVPVYWPTGNEVAVMHTTQGDITVKLHGTAAPINVGCFVELACNRFYDHLKFFVRDEGRLVKGGCPTTRYVPREAVRQLAHKPMSGIGRGTTGYWIDSETTGVTNDNAHTAGCLVMAHTDPLGVASCQFYFCLGDLPEMDTVDTVIGQVVGEWDTAERLDVGDEVLGIEVTGIAEGVEVRARVR